MTDIADGVVALCRAARAAARPLATADPAAKNAALRAAATRLRDRTGALTTANAGDVDAAARPASAPRSSIG
jgi:gamma-glutamyl phosphate reductase